MNKSPNIMISGYYGFGNAGDEAILASILQGIRKDIPGANVIVLSESPEETSEEHSVPAHDRKDFIGIFRLIGSMDILISGGGGLVQDVTGFSTVVYYLSIVLMAKIRGKKVMLYAQGLGPIEQKKSIRLAKFVMNMTNLITYRDEESRKLSEKIGVSKPPIYVTADPVFALEPAPEDVLAPIAAKEKIIDGRFKLGISIRPWETKVDYAEVVARIADVFSKDLKADVFLFPFQESQDMEICKSVLIKMVTSTHIVKRIYPIPVLMGLIGKDPEYSRCWSLL